MAVAVVLPAGAAVRWLDRPGFTPAALARLASPVYLTVGATWLAASRLQLEPVGVGEPIVELTAVHFHPAPNSTEPLRRLPLDRQLQASAVSSSTPWKPRRAACMAYLVS